MQININDYYLTILSDMIVILNNSENGRRQWTADPITGYNDYTSTLRSTFPDWSKFFFIKTPRKEQLDYCIVDGPKPFEDGYFNGSSRELKQILDTSKDGIMSKYPRIIAAWDIAIEGYFDYIRDFEEEYGESFY